MHSIKLFQTKSIFVSLFSKEIMSLSFFCHKDISDGINIDQIYRVFFFHDKISGGTL